MPTEQKRPKRANGEGALFRNAADTLWIVRVTVEGKRRKVSATTQKEALALAKKLKSRAARVDGLPADPTVGEWLDHWRTDILPGTVKRTTEESYAFIIKDYLKPHIGRRKLDELKPAHVREMLSNLKHTSKTKAGEPLSPNTKRIALAVLRRALARALQDEMVARNVAAMTDGVKLERQRGRSLTPDDARRVITAIQASNIRIEALLTLLISTGLRKGEALGLRWEDIDLTAKTAHIRRTLSRTKKVVGAPTLYLAESTKTASSDRIAKLSDTAVDALKRWKAAQKEEFLAWPLGL